MSKKNELMNENFTLRQDLRIANARTEELERINKELIDYINKNVYNDKPYELIKIEEKTTYREHPGIYISIPVPVYNYNYIIKLKEEGK